MTQEIPGRLAPRSIQHGDQAADTEPPSGASSSASSSRVSSGDLDLWGPATASPTSPGVSHLSPASWLGSHASDASSPPPSPRPLLASSKPPRAPHIPRDPAAVPPRLDLAPALPGSEAFDRHLRALPQEHIGALFIDHARYSKKPDPLLFDYDSPGQYESKAEPGYAQAMVRAFAHVRATMNTPLDASGYEALHALATAEVRAPDHFTAGRAPMGRHFATSGEHGYGIDTDSISTDAWHELDSEGLVWVPSIAAHAMDASGLPHHVREQWKHREEAPREAHLSEIRWRGRHVFVGPRGGAFNFDTPDDRDHAARARTEVTQLCDRYHQELAAAPDAEAKLRAIVRLCRALEIGHFFVDGNQRTTAFLLVNKLLMQNGLKPTILPDPTAFDGYLSAHELVQAVRQGQRRFDALCGQPHS